MLSKELYNQFCKKTYVPVFSQPWWLNATCGADNWNVYVVENSGALFAAMPYYIEEKDNYKKITRPINTQNNGVIYNYPSDLKYCSKLDFEERVLNEIIDFIESLNIDRYEQQFHYSFTNWLPFYWRGYGQILRYTYVIEDTSDVALIENNISSNMKKNIKKAQKLVTVSEDFTAEKFYRINKMTFDRQEIAIPYSLDYFIRINAACKEHNSGKMLFAVDENNEIHSVAFIVWDEQSVYYLMNGTNPDFKSSQANALLVYESIKIASQMGKKFDFEGSVIKQIEKSFRQYGGIQKPYFRIFKTLKKGEH